MITESILYGDRQSGKTYKIMTEIHDLIQQGKRSEILVVFPAINYLHFWVRLWQDRFPHIPMVDYTSMQAMERIRGKQYGKVFVEDIDVQPDGIFEDKLDSVRMCLRGDDCEITYTCSPNHVSLKSHNRRTSSAEKIRDRVFKARQEKFMRDDMGIATILASIIVASDDKPLIDAVLNGTITAGDAVYELQQRAA